MSTQSAIEWTDATWNPIRGCTKISPGCEHCYAEVFAERWRGIPGHPYEQGFDLRLVPEKLGEPLRWRKPRRIFVNSMSDLFHKDVPDAYIRKVFGVMSLASRHTFQVLTKRAERMREFFADPRNSQDKCRSQLIAGSTNETWNKIADVLSPLVHSAMADPRKEWPLPNVWLGVSAENQECANIRIPPLLETPAAVRFVSLEPLLECVNLRAINGTEAVFDVLDGNRADHVRYKGVTEYWNRSCTRIDWVIVGGESGPGARPIADGERAVRWICNECVDSRIPFFFKQWGGVRNGETGRELDGQTWDEMPGGYK